jgi:hypothetical protein
VEDRSWFNLNGRVKSLQLTSNENVDRVGLERSADLANRNIFGTANDARGVRLAQQMRSEVKAKTKIERAKAFADLKCKYAATRRHADDLIDSTLIPFYGPVLQQASVGPFAFRWEKTWPRRTQSDVNGPKRTFVN